MERMHYIENEDKLIVENIYDPTELIEQNKREKIANGRGSLNHTRMVKVASIDMDHVVALKNQGYDLFSADRDEVRRTLCYIQDNEPDWMTVEGKPFAIWRPKWR